VFYRGLVRSSDEVKLITFPTVIRKADPIRAEMLKPFDITLFLAGLLAPRKAEMRIN